MPTHPSARELANSLHNPPDLPAGGRGACKRPRRGKHPSAGSGGAGLWKTDHPALHSGWYIRSRMNAASSHRPDMTDTLSHFVRAQDRNAAFEILRCILDERLLRGGAGMIKGGHRCVCMTDTPAPFFAKHFGQRRRDGTSFQPFGIQLPKAWVAQRGGLPVIYQPSALYSTLTPEQRFRHVTFELTGARKIDFTWEREWRIPTEALPIEPGVAKVIVHPAYEKLLWQWHEYEQDLHARSYLTDYCGYDPHPYPWDHERMDDDRQYGYHK